MVSELQWHLKDTKAMRLFPLFIRLYRRKLLCLHSTLIMLLFMHMPSHKAEVPTNANLQGDYEFIIKEASAEKIVMQGKKYGNTIVMYALPDDLNWEAYINSVNDVEENAFFIQYQLLVDGNLVGMTQRSNYTFVIAYNDGGNIVQEQSPFPFTTDGFRFRNQFHWQE